MYVYLHGMGRKKEYEERITLPLSGEMLAGLDSVVQQEETRLTVIRDAIDREVKRRKRAERQPVAN